MEQMASYASLVPLVVIIPFVGMLINLFLGKYMSERMVGFVASLAAGLAFTVAMIMTAASIAFGYESVVVTPPILSSWIVIPSAGIDISWQQRVDTLSLTMMLVVTGVGTLIHIYAVGYMHGDERFSRFFVYLNMFLGFMLILVTGNNLLMLFVGWEGVGLASFTLIGFWFDKKKGVGWKNSDAARKAFIVNRVGDFGLMTAIFLAFWTFGTLDFYKPGEVAVVHHGAAETHSESAPAEGDSHSEGSGGEATPQADATPEASSSAIYPASFILPADGLRRGDGAEEEKAGPKGIFGQAEQFLEEGGKVVHFGPFSLPFESVLTLICLLMLVGAAGKSAQIPLFVWLPDAMAGPTPVSALIHAATMVTAGIYLITRCNVFFSNAPMAAATVTIIGSLTALMAGFVALGQWDIKRVLAYSTVSQLGFMIAATGLGGYQAAMFHLVTHAFFKACLFLGSGSVIHAVEHGHHHAHAAHGKGHGDDHEEAHGDGHGDGHDGDHHEEEDFDPQDMRNMGGLASRMPVTYWTYLIATLALAGIFPLSGFWSKDEILGKAFKAGFTDGKVEGYLALVLLVVAAGFTAFYMWRQIKLVFHGAPRTEAAAHAPENPPVMTMPLVILATLSVLGGLLNLPLALGFTGLPLDQLTLWLEQSVATIKPGVFYLGLALVATLIAVLAIILADRVYGVRQPVTARGNDLLYANPSTRNLFRLANAKLYWDEFYFNVIVYPFQRSAKFLADKLDWEFWHDGFHNSVVRDGFNRLSQILANPVDKGGIDAFFLSLGKAVNWVGARIRTIQTGYVRTYAFTMLLGVLFIIILILFPLLRQLFGAQ
jgi:NADH-quinone oxidoreductase subunit L